MRAAYMDANVGKLMTLKKVKFASANTGIWYYVLDILNVMPLTELTDSLTSFTDREPNKIYTQIDRLW